MKYLVAFSRIVVGVLFIVSGFIKLNDPVGFSFKLEEYFSSGVLDLPFFMPYALAISIFVVILEVVLGVFLLLGYKRKFTLWSLLLMILFFTFLTFYSAYFNKVTDCGCFGDAIKLTPWESFTKDIILLVFILILVFGRKFIQPILGKKLRQLVVIIALVVCGYYAYFVLNHLPQIDFRPYKIGANIEEGMSVPENAPKAIFEYAWKFNVGGEEQVIVTHGDYPTIDGEFIDVETTEIQKGYEAPIHDFTIEQEGEDMAAQLLNEPKLLMIVAYDLRKTKADAFGQVKSISDKALRNHYKVIGLSASDAQFAKEFADNHQLNFEFYFTDETALKTIVRSNPGALLLEEGTILNKVHFNDLDELEFVNDRPIELNIDLKRSLDSIMRLDQKYRKDYAVDTWKYQMEIDSSNIAYLSEIIAQHGYPGRNLVGEASSAVAWYVIQHSNKIPEYIDLIKKAAEDEDLAFHYYAMMLDRYLMNNKQPQKYGTQGMSYYIGTPEEISLIWPLQQPDSVDIYRQQAGFETSMSENAKRLFGEDFEYKAMSIEEVEALIKQ